MTELKHLKFEKTASVARITLNRPKFNMMNIDMMVEINDKLDTLTVPGGHGTESRVNSFRIPFIGIESMVMPRAVF